MIIIIIVVVVVVVVVVVIVRHHYHHHHHHHRRRGRRRHRSSSLSSSSSSSSSLSSSVFIIIIIVVIVRHHHHHHHHTILSPFPLWLRRLPRGCRRSSGPQSQLRRRAQGTSRHPPRWLDSWGASGEGPVGCRLLKVGFITLWWFNIAMEAMAHL